MLAILHPMVPLTHFCLLLISQLQCHKFNVHMNCRPWKHRL